MYKIKCICGMSEKSFKFNIGQFYVDDCCKKQGYDDLGNKINDLSESKPLKKDLKAEVVEEIVSTSEVGIDDIDEIDPKDYTLDELKKIAEANGVTGYKSEKVKSSLFERIKKQLSK